MTTNLTKSVTDWWDINITQKEDLFWWNVVMGYAGQPECKVSFITGTQVLVPQCSDSAWVVRALFLILSSSAIVGAIILGVLGYIAWKAGFEESGDYVELQT